MSRSRKLQLIALLAALVILVVLVARFGPRTLFEQTMAAGTDAIWMLVAYVLGTTLGALPWYFLLPVEARPEIHATVVSRFAASGANAILPLFGIGGEPVRLLWLPAQHAAVGVAAIVIDRLVYVAASAIFLSGGALAAIGLTALPSNYALGAAVGALALLSMAAIGTWLIARHQIAGRIHRLIARIRRRAIPDNTGFAGDVDRAVTRILMRRRQIAVALVLSVLARVALGAEIYAGFRALDIPISLDVAFVLAAVPVFLAFAGAIVPSQIGLQEGSLALVASAIGLPPSTAVAVVLLQRVRQVVTAAFAWTVIAARRSRLQPRNAGSHSV